MKRFLYLIILCIILAGCKGTPQKQTDSGKTSGKEKPAVTVTVTVTISPYKYFVDQIAKGKVDVNVMVSNGNNPETYEPYAQQMMELSKSALYLKVGSIGFEQTWMKKLQDNAPDMKVIDTSMGIKPAKTPGGNIDPHVWMSCSNARIIASNILKALCELEPKNKAFFEKNYQSLLSIIDKRDSTIKESFKKDPDLVRKFVIYHPILTYFARDYQLEQLAIEEEGRQNLPTATPQPSSRRATQSQWISIHCRATGTGRCRKLQLRYRARKSLLGSKNYNHMTPIIKIEHLSAGYDGKQVLSDVNLTVYQDDYLGIIGPNGGGKTTLMRLILGLMKPTEGTIRYFRKVKDENGKTVLDENGKAKVEETKEISMGYLPQYNQLDKQFPISVYEVVLAGLSKTKGLFSRYTQAQHQQVLDTLERMQLTEFKDRHIAALSGGQLQRVLLARAIVSKPDVVILDEPNTYIDRRFQKQMYEMLEQINKECAIIIVSHDVVEVLNNVKHIACVNQHLHYHDTVDMPREKLEEHFLNV